MLTIRAKYCDTVKRKEHCTHIAGEKTGKRKHKQKTDRQTVRGDRK